MLTETFCKLLTGKVAGFETRDRLATSSPGVAAVIQYGIHREQTAVEAGRSRRVPDVDRRVPVTVLRLLMRLVMMMLMMLVKLPTITQRSVVVLYGGGRRHSRRRSAVDEVPPERRQRKNPARIHLVDSSTLSALLQFQRSPPARCRSERVHATYNLSATVQPVNNVTSICEQRKCNRLQR